MAQILRKKDFFMHSLIRMELFFMSFLLLFVAQPVFAEVQTEPKQFQATIVEITESRREGEANFFEFSARTGIDETFFVSTSDSYPNGLYLTLQEGDRVHLRMVNMPDGTQQIFFDDKVRTPALLLLFGLFVVVTIAVSFFRGLRSLLGLGVTILILAFYLLPALLVGKDPVFSTVIASIFILFVNIHLSHGLRLRTFFAFLGTMAGLLLVWIATVLFSQATSLSGLGTEESSLLLWELDTVQNPIRLFMAAVILGAVGVLDDVAIAQSEVVEELIRANAKFSRKELFFRAMRVGQHHIASTVNTLILVYAGAALPTFLLYFSASNNLNYFLNNEIIAEEIVRTLAGTIALILTVPLATLFATIPQKLQIVASSSIDT